MARASLASAAALVAAGCTTVPDSPYDPDSVVFYGDTVDGSPFTLDGISRMMLDLGADVIEADASVLVLTVDTAGLRASPDPGDVATYQEGRDGTWEPDMNGYWRETSFDHVGVELNWAPGIQNLAGRFVDYFHGDFGDTTLTTSGLAPNGWPMTLSGDETFANLSVRFDAWTTKPVKLDASGTFASASGLAGAWQAIFDAVEADWVTCSAAGGEITMTLNQPHVSEGTFIRVRGGGKQKDKLGLDGPIERPGDALLAGKPLAGSLVTNGTERVELEVRDGDHVRRPFTVPIDAGTWTSPAQLASDVILPVLNAELAWVYVPDVSGDEDDRIRLRMHEDWQGLHASIRITGGFGLAELGLDGPRRVDGLVTLDGRNTLRKPTADVVGEALSLYMQTVVDADPEVVVSSETTVAVKGYIADALKDYAAFMVVFHHGPGIPSRRASANETGYFDVCVTGASEVCKQLQRGRMVGTGHADWETWAHELGHVIGFDDLYATSTDDDDYSEEDYVNNWGLMDSHPSASHVVGWHKLEAGWVQSVKEVALPPVGTETFTTTAVTLGPLEYGLADYAGAGTVRHLARLRLSDEHAILLENRQTGEQYSQHLPRQSPGGPRGGLLVTDACDAQPCEARPPVTVLNPHGTSDAEGLADGETHHLGHESVFPAYPGNVVRVVGSVPGPGGLPGALKVEIDRGPAEYVDLEIEPWNAPAAYVTPDIWVDWPGDGLAPYPGGHPPAGNVESAHWHPNGSVVNHVVVRVHNRGTVPADGVRVEASVTDIGAGDEGYTPLDEDPPPPQTVPAGEWRDFRFTWRPKVSGHACILAEVTGHSTDAPESDLTNNKAKENITSYHPQKGSPYAPVPIEFSLRNGADHGITVEVYPSGLRPGVDLELETAQVVIGPRQRRYVRGWLHVAESIPPAVKHAFLINLHAFRATGDGRAPLGGFSASVFPTLPSELELDANGLRVRPQGALRFVVVRGRLSGERRAGRKIDVALVDATGQSLGGTGTTDAEGTFDVIIEGVTPGPAEVMAYYMGPDMAPASAGPLDVAIE